MYIQKKLNLIIQLILIQTLQLKCGSKFCEIYNFQISRTDNKFSYLINIYIYIFKFNGWIACFFFLYF